MKFKNVESFGIGINDELAATEVEAKKSTKSMLVQIATMSVLMLIVACLISYLTGTHRGYQRGYKEGREVVLDVSEEVAKKLWQAEENVAKLDDYENALYQYELTCRDYKKLTTSLYDELDRAYKWSSPKPTISKDYLETGTRKDPSTGLARRWNEYKGKLQSVDPTPTPLPKPEINDCHPVKENFPTKGLNF